MASACTSAAARKHQFEEPLAGHRLPRPGQQRTQHRQLARRQVHRLAVQAGAAAVGIDLQAAEGWRQARLPFGAASAWGAPRQRTHARFQFVQVEGLGQVVVGAGVQAQDAVADRAARGEDQHRRRQPGGARLGQHLQPVQAGQAQVEQHHVGQAGVPAVQRASAVAAGHHLHAAALEAALQRGLHRQVVFHQQELHGADLSRHGAPGGRGRAHQRFP